MHRVTRIILITLLAAALNGPLSAMEDPGLAPAAKPALHPAEYRRSDANFYPKAEFVKDHPTAVIIPYGGYTQKGDTYFFTPKIRAPKDIYFEVLNDWIEPLTPPEGPASLGIVVDAMQIREPQGDVQIALPTAPANFVPATNGMTIPNGTVIKTGANGTAAILFGGVDSARLMPNSEAAVQQTVTAQSHSAGVDLTAGGVFSKVGTQVGVKGEYEVHTPFGNATAQGGDFVTLSYVAKTPHIDVWVAQGTVDLVHSDGTKVGQISSDGTGPLRVLRSISDPTAGLQLGVQELTEILDFIPLANQKIKALREKAAQGLTLTSNEEAYLKRVKKVPSLIKLALVPPPASAPTALASPAVSPPIPPIASASAPTSPASSAPLRAVVRVDGKINFQGATYDLPGFKSKLEAMVKATPDPTIVIKAGKTVPYENVEPVFDLCREVHVKYVSSITPTSATASPAAAPVEHPAMNLPAPALLLHASMEPIPRAPSPPATNAPPPGGP